MPTEDLARILTQPVDSPYWTDKACRMSTQQSTCKRIRAGLYRVTMGEDSYTVEQHRLPMVGQVWRVEDENVFYDQWRGDYETLRAAVAIIEAGLA